MNCFVAGGVLFTLYARPDDRNVSVRVGVSVPIPTASAGAVTVPISFNYQSIGTNIDAVVSMTKDGRYRAQITLSDSSLVAADAGTPGSNTSTSPSIRQYSTSSLLVLRDGQQSEFSVGTDKITGETVKCQVTITALK